MLCLVGLSIGAVISSVTGEYYTGLGKSQFLKSLQQSSTGAGTNIIAGLCGMISTFSICFFIICCGDLVLLYALAGFYGVAPVR
jgi:K(+)-stimulated pyrophosphate-energized sodium pump